MTTLTLTASTEEAKRINGCVCTNGSRLRKVGRDQWVLVFSAPQAGWPEDTIRVELSAQEAATFVRNYLDEGFDNPIKIG
jgi:hypothetical protein